MWKFVEAIWTVRDSPWTVWAASGIIYAINCVLLCMSRNGSGPGESGYSSKPAPFGPGMDYTYWTVDVYGDTRINPRGDGGGDGLTLTPALYPPRPAPSPLPVK